MKQPFKEAETFSFGSTNTVYIGNNYKKFKFVENILHLERERAVARIMEENEYTYWTNTRVL